MKLEQWNVDWQIWDETWTMKCGLKEIRWNMNNEIDNVTQITKLGLVFLPATCWPYNQFWVTIWEQPCSSNIYQGLCDPCNKFLFVCSNPWNVYKLGQHSSISFEQAHSCQGKGFLFLSMAAEKITNISMKRFCTAVSSVINNIQFFL